MMLALQRVSHNLLRLSEWQEELMKETRRTTANSPQMPELADRQEHLKAGLDRVASQLYELGQKTFYVAPQIGSAIGQAHDNMRKSVSSLETRNSSASANQQAHATMSLNEAVKFSSFSPRSPPIVSPWPPTGCAAPMFVPGAIAAM